MASSPGLADMPQEVLTMILREVFANMIIRKVKFTKRRVQNSRNFSRSWVPVMLINKTISHIAKDIFSQEVVVQMKAAQLVSTKARGVGADQRCGEKELQYFEQALGDINFVESLLYYTSDSKKQQRGSGLRYTMFSKLKRVYMSSTWLYMEDMYEIQRVRSLMDQYREKDVHFAMILMILDYYGSITVLLDNNSQAQLVKATTMPKEAAEQIRSVIETELNCEFPLSYEVSANRFPNESNSTEILRGVYTTPGIPNWAVVALMRR